MLNFELTEDHRLLEQSVREWASRDVAPRIRELDRAHRFDPAILPAEFMGFRREFEARQHLSLFRSLYLARRYPQARQEYLEGIRLCPSLLFDLSHLRKFLRTLGRG